MRLIRPCKPNDVTLYVSPTYELGNSGAVKLGNVEVITYTGKTDNSLTGVTRGVNSQASTHPAGTKVEKVTSG
jgi:hypothetical protein